MQLVDKRPIGDGNGFQEYRRLILQEIEDLKVVTKDITSAQARLYRAVEGIQQGRAEQRRAVDEFRGEIKELNGRLDERDRSEVGRLLQEEREGRHRRWQLFLTTLTAVFSAGIGLFVAYAK